jgi:hypothetical protein
MIAPFLFSSNPMLEEIFSGIQRKGTLDDPKFEAPNLYAKAYAPNSFHYACPVEKSSSNENLF